MIMKMITTILIEDDITVEDFEKMNTLRTQYAKDNPEWEDDGELERMGIVGELLQTGLVNEDSKVMVEIRYED
jgi:hypothetical protein